MKLLFLTAFVACASAASLTGGKCAWGPSYWCSHVAKARECGAFQHCLDTVWSKQIIKQTKIRPQCDLCQIVVKETRTMVKKNADKLEVLAFFLRSCQFMPDDQLQSECERFVKDDAEGIMTLLKSNLSAEKVCATAALCQGFEDQRHKSQVSKPVPPPVVLTSKAGASKICNDCVAFMTDCRDLLIDNQTVEAIREVFKTDICPEFGAEEGLCDMVADEFITEALQYLYGVVDPNQICGIIGFCNATDVLSSIRMRIQYKDIMKKFLRQKIIGSSEVCLECETIVKELKNIESDPTVQDKVKLYLENLCDKMGVFAAKCKSAVANDASFIFDLMQESLDGKVVCSMIGFCKAVDKPKQLSVKPDVTQPQKSPVKSEFLCHVCETLTADFESYLQEKHTQEEIKEKMLSLCDKFTGSIQTECKTVVEQYLIDLIELGIQEWSPLQLCQGISLCSAGSSQKVKKITAGSSTECILCEFVMTELDKLLVKNSTEAEIIAALDKVCSILPSTIKDECNSFVNTYGPAVIELLKQDLDPKQVCTRLGLCSSLVKKVTVGTATTCEVCKLAMKELDSILDKSSTQAEIEAAVDKICSLLPSTLSQECNDFVAQYGPAIIKLLEQELDPEQICTTLGLCSSSVKKVAADSTLCVLCEYVMKEIDGILDENSTTAEIEAAVNKICDKLPTTISQECKNFVNMYGPEVIKLLEQKLEPKEICTIIGLCTSSVKKVKVTVHASEECEACKLVVTELSNYLKENSTQEEIMDALNKVCSILPSQIKDTCDQFVKDNGKAFIQILLEELDPDNFCTALGLCQSSAKKVDVGASTECVMCEFAMKKLDGLLSKNSTEQDIMNALNAVCMELPKTISTECISFVTTYGPAVVEILVKEMDPSKVCTELGLCGQSKTSVKVRAYTSSITCEVCQKAIEFLKIWLQDKTTQSEIESILQKVCSFVPTQDAGFCKKVVAAAEELIIGLINDEISPEQLCSMMIQCDSAKKSAPDHAISPPSNPQLVPLEMMPVPGQIPGLKLTKDECITCEILVNYIGLAFKEQSTVGSIEKFLKSDVCSLVPSLNTECKNLVTNKTPAIALAFANNIDPKEICQDINICPTQTRNVQIQPAMTIKKPKSDSTLYFVSKKKMLGRMPGGAMLKKYLKN